MLRLAAVFTLAASPAFAAKGPFVSLTNTDFVVLLAFALFVIILLYFKVPSMIGGLLDQRAEGIKAELDEARSLKEEAQALLASYEKKQAEVQSQADRIVETARQEAAAAAAQAKDDIAATIARRIQGAEDQIAAAEASAVREVRDRAVSVAIAAAQSILAKGMTAQAGSALIDDAIAEVDAKLH